MRKRAARAGSGGRPAEPSRTARRCRCLPAAFPRTGSSALRTCGGGTARSTGPPSSAACARRGSPSVTAAAVRAGRSRGSALGPGELWGERSPSAAAGNRALRTCGRGGPDGAVQPWVCSYCSAGNA